jgi:hypothetical protein
MYQESIHDDSYFVLYPRHNSDQPPPHVLSQQRLALDGVTRESIYVLNQQERTAVIWVDHEKVDSHGSDLVAGQAFQFGLGLTGRLLEPVHFTKGDILRWIRVRDAVENMDGEIREPNQFRLKWDQPRYKDQAYHLSFLPSASHIPYRYGLDPEGFVDFLFTHKMLLVSICTLPALYGGIHLTAFNFDFPSPTERLLWIIAAIYIMAASPVAVAFERIRYHLWYMVDGDVAEDIVDGLYRYSGLLILLGYVLARTYLVVESFAGLRATPIGVYWTPAWLQMIPHI